MNPSVIEAEIVYQQAKVTEKQRPYLNGLIEDIKKKSFVTGIVAGFCLCAGAFILGLAVVIF